jgi:hypothetical protein
VSARGAIRTIKCALGTVALALGTNAFAVTEYYPPLSSQVDMSQLPGDLVASSSTGPGVGEKIRIKSFLYSEIQNEEGVDVGAKINLKLVVPEAAELNVPGLDGVLSVAIGTGEFEAEAIVREDHATAPTEDFPFILTIKPGSSAFAVRFKTDVLKPVQPGTFQPYPGTPPVPELQIGAGLKIVVKYSWDGDPDVQIMDGAGTRPTLTLNTPVMIGETGVVLEVSDAEIDLSRTSSSGTLPPSWIGVRFGKLAVNFVNGLDVPRVEHGAGAPPPPPQMAGIAVTDFTLGSGGVSGGICGNLTAGPTLPLFDADFQLSRLCVTLQEGSLTAGEAAGVLAHFPYFDAPVRLALALSMDGNFKVGLSPPDPAHPSSAVDLEIPGVLVYHLEALSIEKKQETYLWNTSGTLNVNAISTQAEDAIRVNGLTITSDGQVQLDGGWLTLPGKKTIDFNGFNVELAEIGFGSEDAASGPGKSWVGFTGGVELVGDLGASAKFKKLQYLWSSGGGNVDVRLQGVDIAFRKPGAIAFHGALDYFDDPVTHDKGFAGKVAVNVEAVRLAIDGRLVVGKARPPGQDPFAFFFVDLAVSLPAGIPVFPEVSLYGLTGLFSYRMTPNIVAFTTPVKWFEAHLAATNMLAVPTGHPAAPWRTQSDALALGAGVIVGTSSDDGFIVNAKLALMISLPGPVVMLNGAANLIKERGALLDSTNRPTYTAVAIYDGSLNTFIINIGAYYDVIDLIKVEGQAEAFFDLADPNNWHVWIGKDQPEERRIRAEVLGFLKANSYLMVDGAAFKQGASAGYDGRWKFGPLKVVLSSMFGYDMNLFWRPVQVWGQVGIRGEFELSAFGIGIGVSGNADVDGQTPSPLYVDGKFHVKIKLPWPLPDPQATVHLRWEHERDKFPLAELAGQFAIEPRKGGTSILPDTVSASGDSARAALPANVALNSLCRPGDSVLRPGEHEIRCSRPLVPQDVLAVAAFQRDVNDVDNLGFGNPFDPAAPKLDTISDATFQYDLNGFEILQAGKTGAATLNFGAPLPGLYGAWPALAGGPDTAALSLRVLSRNPLDIYQHSTSLFYQNGTAGWTDWAVDQYGPQYCFDLHDAAPGLLKTGVTTPGWKCPLPPGLLTGDDFILPPYSAFLFAVDTDVTPAVPTGNVHDRIYRNYSIFHTEGPPLALDPYVEVTSPASDRRPHYRAYDIGLRFNESYMDLLYRRPGQLFQVQLLDDNDQPVMSAAAPVTITTDWDLAATHVPRATQDDWLQFLRDHGVPVDTLVPRDDRVFGRVNLVDAIRGGERYKVRLWFEDPHLAADTRLGDADWLAANPVRFRKGNRVVVYEFPLLSSKFRTFTELVQSYPHNYVEAPLAGAVNLTQLATLAGAAAPQMPLPPPALSNASSVALGHYLRHALSPSGPEDVPWPQVEDWIRRAPGYSGKPERMSEDERQALRDSWSAALGAYEEIDKLLALESQRRPLPERLELRALRDGASTIGMLIEAPEPIDFTRVLMVTWRPGTGIARPTLIPNRDNTRFFVFHVSAGAVQPWPDDLHTLAFALNRVVGDRYPVLRSADPGQFEVTAISVNLPADKFVPEAP